MTFEQLLPDPNFIPFSPSERSLIVWYASNDKRDMEGRKAVHMLSAQLHLTIRHKIGTH